MSLTDMIIWEKCPFAFYWLQGTSILLAKTVRKRCCAHHAWHGSCRLQGPVRPGGTRSVGAETSPAVPSRCFPIAYAHVLMCEQLPPYLGGCCQSQTGIPVGTCSPAKGSSIIFIGHTLCMRFAVGIPTTPATTWAKVLLKRGLGHRSTGLSCLEKSSNDLKREFFHNLW